MAKGLPYDVRLAAVRRVRIGGEVALRVAESVGVAVRQLYRWEKDPEIRRDLGLVDPLPPPAIGPTPAPPTARAAAPAAVEATADLLSDTDLKRLVDAVRDGLAPARALRVIGRHPSAWKVWCERADKGDEAVRRVVEMVTRADAELERACVLAIRKGGMGWQGPAWLLERRMPEVYSADAAAAAGAADDFSTEELITVVRDAGLLDGVL